MTMFTIANLGDSASGSIIIPTSTFNASGTVNTGGYIFVNNTSASPMTLTLTAALTPFVQVMDIGGNAGTYTITVSYSGGINAGTTTFLNVNYQWRGLVWNGSRYSLGA